MWDKMTTTPVLAFSTPSQAEPPPVAEARVEFDRLGDRLGFLRGEIQDAKQAVKAATAADREATTAAFLAAKEPRPPVTAAHDKATEALKALEALVPGLTAAVDQAGDRLAEQIAEHADSWADALSDAGAASAARFDELRSQMAATLRELANAHGATAWLSDFSLARAKVGRQNQYPGGRLAPMQLRGEPGLSGDHDPETFVRVLAAVTAQAEPRRPRKHIVVESVR